ncbi:MAG: hypothetical protein QF805_09895, partial [Pirellulaceae bacterium]|nr:hypothetical protein [Pirellulaceae bacterium]
VAAPPATAQEADPFGAGAAPDPGAAADAPAAGGGFGISETDPAILGLRESNPQTPEQLARAVQITMNLARLDEMQVYLDKLIAGADEPAMVRLQRQFGTAFFLRLSNRRRYGDKAADFAARVIEVTATDLRQAERLQALVQQLSDVSAAARRSAMVGLQDAGVESVAQLLPVLADDARQAEHPAVRQAIVDLGLSSHEPLIALLTADKPRLVADACLMLGKLRSRDALPHLIEPFLNETRPNAVRQRAGEALVEIVGIAPAKADGMTYLQKRIDALLRGTPPRKPDYLDQVSLWDWDSASSTPSLQRMPVETARYTEARRLIGSLLLLDPENVAFRRQAVMSSLQAAKLGIGVEEPLATDHRALREATALGVDELALVLNESLQKNVLPAAIGAMEALTLIGDEELLHTSTGRFSPIALALSHADPNVRFSAVKTITAFNPQRGYAGSSRYLKSLSYFITSAGSKRAIVAHPRLADAQTIVGMLRELGYEGMAVTTGKSLLREAARHPDYEFAFISTLIDRRSAYETVQLLRQDPQTARLPVALYARTHDLDKTKERAELDPLTLAMPRPHNPGTLSFYMYQLEDLARVNETADFIRMRQATESIDVLAKLAAEKRRNKFYDFLRYEGQFVAALRNPALTLRAADILGHLDTPLAQQSLVDFAGESGVSDEHRQAAMANFKQSVDRVGLQM